MEHSIDLKLFDELFAPVKDYEKCPQAESSRPLLKQLLPYEPEKALKECSYLTFVGIICLTYGMGDMDICFDRDSPSWCQVWFTAEEITAEVQNKGYSLTVSKAKFYLRKLLGDKRRLIETRTGIERGIEYRRVRLMFDCRRNCIENI